MVRKTRKHVKKHKHTKMCAYCGSKCTCRNKKGGSGCGAYGCPLAPLSWDKMQQSGGQCVTGCGPILGIAQNGGGDFNPPAPVPGPFVGEPTSGFVSQWPSVDGISGNRNYYDMNMYKSDPQTMMKVGGKRRVSKGRKQSKKGGRKRSRKGVGERSSLRQRGGLTSLAPQELVNLGRELGFNYQSAYNSLNGVPAPVSPDPWKGQLQPSTK